MIGGALALIALLLHAGTSWRYGYFRDELYFIACSKHLAWGYVDQPPLVAVAAWLASPFGYNLVALRVLPVIAAAFTVWVAVALTRELGGGRFATWLCGLATLLTPAYLLLGNVLTTTSFEPLAWTLLVYCVVRVVRGAGPLWWLTAATAFAFGMYGKYSIALLAVALAIGLAVSGRSRLLASTGFVLALLVALALLAPNLVWQGLHGWPMLDVLRGDAAHRPAFQTGVALEYRGVWNNALAFATEQFVYTNPLAVPLWIAGIVAPFRLASLRDVRFIGVAYVVLFGVAVALEAKGYYVIGIYASLFAVGSVALERAASPVRNALAGGIVIVGIVAMPFSIPVLGVDTLIGYTKILGLTGRDGSPARLIQPVFAEEFGWQRLAGDVASVYDALPPAVRNRTAVYADTYADAGAIDLFGPEYGLPPAISSQNSYYLWGTHGYDGSSVIAIGATRADLLGKYFRSVTLVKTSTEPYKWVVEGPTPIFLCRDPIAPLDRIWPELRWYGA